MTETRSFWCQTCNMPTLEVKYDENGGEYLVCLKCKSHFTDNGKGYIQPVDNAAHLVLHDKPPLLGLA